MTVTNKGSASVSARIRCAVLKDGDRVAQTNDARMPVMSFPAGVSMYHADKVIPFDAVDFYGSAKNTAVRTGMLPEGAYELCAVLIDAKANWIGTEVCTGFMLTDYQPPVLLTPPDASVLRPDERPVFRWTPVAPQPAYIVRYQVLVFEVLQGQRPTQALRVNRPILDKTLQGATELVWPPEYQLPGRVEKYVWTVRALDDRNQPVGMDRGYTAGYAEPFGFSVTPSTAVTATWPSMNVYGVNDDGIKRKNQEAILSNSTTDVTAALTNLRWLEEQEKRTYDATVLSSPPHDTVPSGEWQHVSSMNVYGVNDDGIKRQTEGKKDLLLIDATADGTMQGGELKKKPKPDGGPKSEEFVVITGTAVACTSGDGVTLHATSTPAHPANCTESPTWYGAGTMLPVLTNSWDLAFSPTTAGSYSFTVQCPAHPSMSQVFTVTVTQGQIAPYVTWWGPEIMNPPFQGDTYLIPCGQAIKVLMFYPGVTGHPLTHTWSILSGAECMTDVLVHNNMLKAKCTTGAGCGCAIELLYTVRDVNGCIGKKTLKLTCKP